VLFPGLQRADLSLPGNLSRGLYSSLPGIPFDALTSDRYYQLVMHSYLRKTARWIDLFQQLP